MKMAESPDILMPDAPNVNDSALTEGELNAKFPDRPRNHSQTIAFHHLFEDLFNPLSAASKKKPGPTISRKKHGPHGPTTASPWELRHRVIENFIANWREKVGNDIYPAFRLIIPDKDRDRPMYGLKEKAIGKILVKVMKINKDSADGQSLANWKIPGNSMASRMAGDFPGRCYEALSKRPMRVDVGDMTIGEVNDMLDRLSAAQKEETQVPIFQEFYNRMNAEELQWLIRIILRQMKVGASERTIFEIWHPDAANLFSISSSMRRVCWELYDPRKRLDGEDKGVTLMQCYQPQLAQFQSHSFQKMIGKVTLKDSDPEFWIEEKLDGERMQMHMVSDRNVPGGKRFGWWSRKAKDYTYLYGTGLYDDHSAMSRHLKSCFDKGVDNLILDGEMVTWDPESDTMVPFGTLKTAAISQQRAASGDTGHRPVYKIFDILYLNGSVLTNYELRDRRRALEASIKPLQQRFEIHTYKSASIAQDIEDALSEKIEKGSEGLVLKNPSSAYNLNERNDDWMKVKPEYMKEFGENLDCVIVGGYYGTGKRGGAFSSYLCGLRVDEHQIKRGAHPEKCWSFFKVGGGMTVADYSAIKHRTEGKWRIWDPKRPPNEFIELAGGNQKQLERPDEWIRPSDSVVIAVKGASVHTSDRFRMGYTIRFPRFTGLKTDKKWEDALSIQGFLDLKSKADAEREQRKFEVDDSRRKRARTSRKKEITVAGAEDLKTPYAGKSSMVLEGLSFYVISGSDKIKQSKAEIEQYIKANGGKVYQTHDAVEDIICISDKRVVRVAALQKAGGTNIVQPTWLTNSVKQAEIDQGKPKFILPHEPQHMFHTTPEYQETVNNNYDCYGDSYCRDIEADELAAMIDRMNSDQKQTKSDSKKRQLDTPIDTSKLLLKIQEKSSRPLRAHIFSGYFFYFAPSASSSPSSSSIFRTKQAKITAQFASANVVDELDDEVTHVIISNDNAKETAVEVRKTIAERMRMGKAIPRVVKGEWVEECWKEGTVLDEEGFAVV